MTKPTVTLDVAVRTINSIITQAQQDGWVPEFSHPGERLPDPADVAAHATIFPPYSLEFRKEFAGRLSLYIRPEMPGFREAEFTVGTSGNHRDLDEALAVADAMRGLVTMTRNIKAYMESVEMVPTAEAKAFVEAEGARRQAEHVASQAAYAAQQAEEKAQKAKKALANRRLNKLAGHISSEDWRRVATFIDDGKFQEALDAIDALKA